MRRDGGAGGGEVQVQVLGGLVRGLPPPTMDSRMHPRPGLATFSRALESQIHHVVAGLLDFVRELVRECGLDGLSPWSLGLSERLY